MRRPFLCAIGAAFLFGCGDGSRSPNTTLTAEMLVDVPYGLDAATLTAEYTLLCGESQIYDGSEITGELAPVGPTPVNGVPGFAWTAETDAPPGLCSVVVKLRDAEGEVVCTEYGQFVAAPDAPIEVDLFIGCEV